MSTMTMEDRITVKCSWCDEKQLIPLSMAGCVMKCLNCGVISRAYGYLPPPDPSETAEPLDCHGGAVSALIFVLGFWMVAGSIVHWVWY